MFVRLRPIPISATPSQSLLYYLLHFSCYSPHLCYYLLHLGYCLPSAATQSISSAASCSICSYSLLLYSLLLFTSVVHFCYSLLLLAACGLLLALALLLSWQTYLSPGSASSVYSHQQTCVTPGWDNSRAVPSCLPPTMY